MNFCPEHNFQSIEANNFKLNTQVEHIKEKCSVQEPWLYSIYFWKLVTSDFTHR